MIRVVLIAAVLLLAACATQRAPVHEPQPVIEDAKPEPIDPQKVTQIELDAIRALIEKEQYYAALAHIEAQRPKGGGYELIWLEAETRRHLNQRAAADGLYRRLLNTPFDGQAYHGLGLLATATDLEAAIRSLRAAAQRLPTDVEVRNDLGYALMEAGRYTEAQPELSTAAELAPDRLKSRNNLIILMLLTGNQTGLNRLTEQSGTTPEALKQLKDQAQAIRGRQQARVARSSG